MPASADRLFTCGIEENNLTASSVMWTGQSGSPTISTTTVRSGTYAARLLGSASKPYLQRNLSANMTSGTLYTRFYYRFPTLPAVNVQIAQSVDSGGANAGWTVTLLTTGVLRLTNNVTATTDDGSTLSVNTWYRLEVRQLLSNTVGELELRLDGVSDASITGEDTLPTNILAVTFGNGFVGGNNHSHDQFYDDMALNNDSGSFQTSWPGDGKIVYVEGAADDAVTWTALGAGTRFSEVDELPGSPDDATSYNADSGTTNEDRLGHGGLPAEVDTGDTMVLIDAYARVSAGAASQTMRLLIWDEGGSQTTGPSIALGNGTWAMLTTAQHLVVTLSGKTKANADSYDLGYEGLTGASEKRISTLWANVEYQEAAAGGGWPPGSQQLLIR
jgi:hypothetical protein